MRKTVVSTIVVWLFCAACALATDLNPPEWRGWEGTTYQHWCFDDADNPASPEIIDNDYGQASAAITVGLMGEGWMDNPGLGTQTGIWDLGGAGGQIVLDIDNRPLPLEYKEISIQVTYYQGISVIPTVEVPGAQFVSSNIDLVEEDMMFWGWYLERSIWRIYPNPDHEQIIITSDPSYGSLIDQVVVDTYCIPEPVTGCLLTLAGAVLLGRRKRHIAVLAADDDQ